MSGGLWLRNTAEASRSTLERPHRLRLALILRHTITPSFSTFCRNINHHGILATAVAVVGALVLSIDPRVRANGVAALGAVAAAIVEELAGLVLVADFVAGVICDESLV